MKRISIVVITFVITTVSACSALAQTNKDKIVAEIMKLEAEHIEASKKLSAEALDRIQTADFAVTVRIPPKLVTGTERSARLKDPNFKRGTVDLLENDNVNVRVYNENTAVTTGHWKRVSRDDAGKDTSAAGRFTHVWVKQNGKWLLAAAHYSPDIDLEKLKNNNAQTENKKQ